MFIFCRLYIFASFLTVAFGAVARSEQTSDLADSYGGSHRPNFPVPTLAQVRVCKTLYVRCYTEFLIRLVFCSLLQTILAQLEGPIMRFVTFITPKQHETRNINESPGFI